MADIDRGSIVFVRERRPPLTSGKYVVTVEQGLTNKDVTDSGAQGYISGTYRRSRRFAVKGPRFTLPQDACSTVFPPDGSRGEFSDCVPHVVLTNRSLPWTRASSPQEDPWLALLLFDEADASPLPHVVTRPIAELVTPKELDVASYGDAGHTAGQEFQFDDWEPRDTPCQTIDVPVATFRDIAPALAELQWLTHVRRVSPDAKAGTRAPDTLDYAVVFGNRRPIPNTRCTAHLVSLEHMGGFLPTDNYTKVAVARRDGGPASLVRLVTLANWSFTSIDPAETFTGLLQRVSVGPLARPFSGRANSVAAADVRNAFGLGYTAVTHHTRAGDRAVSWYRGPFVPFNVSGRVTVPPRPDATPGEPGPATADALVAYDPNTRMLDPSYAAAWQIGKLLALRDRHFSIALYNWKRANALQTSMDVEQQLIADTFGGNVTALLRAGPSHNRGVVLRSAAAVVARSLKKTLHITDGKQAVLRLASGPRHYGRPRRRLARRAASFKTLTDAVGSRDRLSTIHAATTVPDDIAQWLAKLRLLSGVPFNYLVPDAGMLPVESLRFFQVDLNWTRSLLEGAFSIGRSTSGDAAHDDVMSARVHGAAHAQSRQIRALRPRLGDPLPHVSGFLLRSAVVSGWPTLEVHAFGADGQPLTTVLRMERLAPTLLLFIVEGLLDSVAIQEPSEGLHFGTKNDKRLRSLTTGETIAGTSITATYRPSGAIRILDLVQALQGKDKLDTTITPAEFALQMVEGVQEVVFPRLATP